jgi:thioredoxin 1
VDAGSHEENASKPDSGPQEAKAVAYSADYVTTDPSRAEIDRLPGITVLEFGNAWCGHCRRAEPLVRQALAAEHLAVRHIRIADASGKRLGRSYQVKLWPTLIFLRDGIELARLVRPRTADDLATALGAVQDESRDSRREADRG